MKILRKVNSIALHWKIIISIFLGVIYSFVSVYFGWQDFSKDWLKPLGTIFINLLKLIAVPLVLFSIITGVADIVVGKLKKIFISTILSYLVTTLMAILLGLFLVNFFLPGKKIGKQTMDKNYDSYSIWAVNNKIPLKPKYQFKNFATQQDESKQAFLEKDQVKLDKISKNLQTKKEGSPIQFLVDMVPSNIFFSFSNNSLMLQVIFFAIFFGLMVKGLTDKYAKPIIDLSESMNHVFILMVSKIMQYSPLFVFALMVSSLSDFSQKDETSIAGLITILYALSWYSFVVVLGLAILIFIAYPLLMKFIARKGYKEFFGAMGQAQLLAFTSSSSAATLPVTMSSVAKLKVPDSIAKFVLPIGATINMDGTSLYQSVAVVYLAQIHGIDLSVVEQATIILTVTLSSIGAAAVPGGSIVFLMVVLESIGLNPAWIAFILPVDRLLDMCRTVTNVSSDALVASVVARFVK